MGQIWINEELYGSDESIDIHYDNSSSQIEAENVQKAIDYLIKHGNDALTTKTCYLFNKKLFDFNFVKTYSDNGSYTISNDLLNFNTKHIGNYAPSMIWGPIDLTGVNKIITLIESSNIGNEKIIGISKDTDISSATSGLKRVNYVNGTTQQIVELEVSEFEGLHYFFITGGNDSSDIQTLVISSIYYDKKMDGKIPSEKISYDDTITQMNVNNVQEAIEWLKNYLNVFIPEDTEVIKNVVIEVLKIETLLSKTTISTGSGYATNSVTFLNNLSNYDSVDFKVYYNDNYILTSYKPTDIIGKSISAPGPENNSMKMNITDTGASGFDCYYNMSLEIIGYRKE